MKFVGKVGFWVDEMETAPGVWQGCIVERNYFGDIINQRRSFQESSESVNDEFRLSCRISILCDLYMRENWGSIRYVKWNGVKWKVTQVHMEYPRISFELGGVYHGEDQVDAPSPLV